MGPPSVAYEATRPRNAPTRSDQGFWVESGVHGPPCAPSKSGYAMLPVRARVGALCTRSQTDRGPSERLRLARSQPRSVTSVRTTSADPCRLRRRR